VEVRSGPEILETLDGDGMLEKLPFMPEMLQYIGRRYVVVARVERACDTHTGRGTRRIPNAVILDDLRCDGSGHDGCGARCRIYWKERWLRKVEHPEQATESRYDPSPALEELVKSAAKVVRPDGSIVYRSHATELLRASELVSGWSIASFRRELACGNVRPARFLRVIGAAVVSEGRARFAAVAAKLEGRLGERALRARSDPAPPREQPEPPRGLEPGQLVRIRSLPEIGRQLDHRHKTRGLYFDKAEMSPYCGREVRVLGRVERFIDEPTGKMVELKSDCYFFDGVVCSGDRSYRRWFCPRAIYPWWRESWVRPVESSLPQGSTAPSGAEAGVPDTAERPQASRGAPPSP